MNVIGMLKPKYSTTYLEAEDSLREGLAIMRESRYTAVPVINERGEYIGTVTEGDFLWQILDCEEKVLDEKKVKDIIKEGWNSAAVDSVEDAELIQMTLQQNFVPMVDDRNCYMGIITRRDFIQNILQKKIDTRYIINSNEISCINES